MKNFVLILLFAVILSSCKDPNIGSENKTTAELLVAHGWKLDKFTNIQGATINDGQIDVSAKALYGLAFDFTIDSRNRKEVKGIDKTSKSVINRGEWDIEEDEKTLDINITGFTGDFDIVQINNTTMILKAKDEKNRIGVGPDVHMVFSEFKL